ncbi:hypothetical protein, partial [Bradyrhizobium sp. TM233]|uniref:hypothetical protein n=1 Tax=Bradyrhizobium sp. TM233 TaxID=2599801 RepID=UPI0030C72C6C
DDGEEEEEEEWVGDVVVGGGTAVVVVIPGGFLPKTLTQKFLGLCNLSFLLLCYTGVCYPGFLHNRVGI